MIELERIVREAHQRAGEAGLLATVVRVEGSSYRRPGARMFVAGDRWISGCVSGGCLEGDVMLRGAHRARDGAVVVTYDSTSDEGEAWGVGLGCNGIVDVLLERIAPGVPNDALAFAAACFAAETSGVLVTVIRSTIAGAPVGARLGIGPVTVAFAVPVQDPGVRAALEQAARGPAGVVEAGGVTVLVETIAPSPQLFVLGSGHDAGPLVALAQSIGFRVTVVDHAIREPSRFLAADAVASTGGDPAKLAALIAAAPEAYVVIMHHQQTADRVALGVALDSRARYIGLLGPARRTRDLFAELNRAPDQRVHAPIGLDIGAETPEQLAVAITGELQAVRLGARGGMVRERARALHADVAVIVLAAGGSRRLGRPKQLVEVAGVPLVRRAVDICLAARTGPVGVVLGDGAAAVAHALGDARVARIVNDGWSEGIASSIRAGVRWAQTTSANAVLVALADQPRVPAAHLMALRDAWLAGAPIAASRFAGVVGAPAVFDRSQWDALLALEGDRGAAPLMRAPDVVAIDCPDGAIDIDTPDDLSALAAAGK